MDGATDPMSKTSELRQEIAKPLGSPKASPIEVQRPLPAPQGPLRELEARLGLDATIRREFIDLARSQILRSQDDPKRKTLTRYKDFMRGLRHKSPAPIPTGQALKIPLPKPSLIERWSYALSMARWRANVAQRLGPTWAALLSDLFAALEQRRWHDALALAIPLEASTVTPLLEQPALAPPPPMTGAQLPLRLPPHAMIRSAPRTLLERLQHHYRLAAQALEANDEQDAVAFIYLELLRSPPQAAMHMVRHHRFAEAAQIATAHQLDPVWTVTLWVQAHDFERAAQLARQHQVYEPALERLQALNLRPQAQELTMRWVEQLLARGDTLGALELAWSAHERAREALSWHTDVLLNAPSPWLEIGQLYISILDEDSPASQDLWHSVKHATPAQIELWAKTLLALPELKDRPVALASWLARASLAAIQEPTFEHIDRAWALARRGPDQALTRELKLLRRQRLRAGRQQVRVSPPSPPAAPPAAPPSPPPAAPPAAPMAAPPSAPLGAPAAQPASELGRPALDMALLSHGHLAIALGELGLLWCDPSGALLERLFAPVSHLVPADHGQRLLGLHPVGDDHYSLVRMEVLTRQWSSWGVTPLVAWSQGYDGEQWLVLNDQQLLAIDATSDKLVSTWRSGELNGSPVGLSRSSSMLTMVTKRANERLEGSAYALPSLPLLERTLWPDGVQGLRGLTPDGCLIVEGKEGLWTLAMSSGQGQLKKLPFGQEAGTLRAIAADEHWVGAIFERRGQWWVEYAARYMTSPMGRVRLGEALPEPQRARLRMQSGHLLAFDDAGRALIIALEGDAHDEPLRLNLQHIMAP